MRALAGPAMMLVMIGGYAIYRYAHKEDAPSREFANLELVAADEDHTGSCYSLSTVLIANGVFGGALRTWTPIDDNSWKLELETVTQAYNGPVHEFQNFTFEQHGEQIRLTAVEASKGRPTDVQKNIDLLLEAPNERHSTPVDRCLKEGGTGYLYKPRK